MDACWQHVARTGRANVEREERQARRHVRRPIAGLAKGGLVDPTANSSPFRGRTWFAFWTRPPARCTTCFTVMRATGGGGQLPGGPTARRSLPRRRMAPCEYGMWPARSACSRFKEWDARCVPRRGRTESSWPAGMGAGGCDSGMRPRANCAANSTLAPPTSARLPGCRAGARWRPSIGSRKTETTPLSSSFGMWRPARPARPRRTSCTHFYWHVAGRDEIAGGQRQTGRRSSAAGHQARSADRRLPPGKCAGMPLDTPTSSLAFSPDGKTVVLGTNFGTVDLMDAASGRASVLCRTAPGGRQRRLCRHSHVLESNHGHARDA